MPHETPLIATIVVGLALAFLFGAIANRLKIPPLAGYLLAGVAVGPFTPGFVADQHLANELAEIGVILLMFGVGLHFSLRDLLSVRALAVPGAIVQMAVATALGAALAYALGWGLGGGLVFGLALSVASTVVLLKALQERRLLETERGRIAVGWLIVEDLAMVLTLVLLPALAGVLGGDAVEIDSDPLAARFELDVWGIIGLTLAKVAAFVALMLIVGRRVIPWILHFIAHTGSRELFRLAVLTIALGVAFGAAKLFGVSFALGAFFAGMVLSESELSHRAAEESLPLRDAFSVLFFVSVGMLFDPTSVLREPLPIIGTLLIIIFGKSIAAFLIVRAFGHGRGTALTISASLAQIGEFSFILAGLGVSLSLLPPEGRDLILAGAILSILLNPVAFAAIDWIKAASGEKTATAAKPAPARTATAPAESVAEEPARPDEDRPVTTSLAGHTVIVGYGRVGSLVGQALMAQHSPFLVIEDGDKPVARLRELGVETIVGNAARSDILEAANVAGAKQLVVAIPNAFEAGQVVERARRESPTIVIVARAHSDAEVDYLTNLGADTVVMGEREIARGMLERLAATPAAMPEPAATAASSDAPAQVAETAATAATAGSPDMAVAAEPQG